MKAVGYFVEGARRDGVTRSIADQNQAFLDFCSAQGYEVAATFIDTESSRPSLAQAGFWQMTEFLQRTDRGFMVVVVDSLGTLGSDLGHAAMKLLAVENCGVSVLLASSGAEAAREMVDVWAVGEAAPASEKVRTAMRRRAVRGEVLGRPPYGYQVGPRRKLEVVPEEAAVVGYIFRLYLHEGLGIRKIAGRLNEESIPTRRGGRWSMVTVRDILRNRSYLGTYQRFGVKVPGTHPALVSGQDFAAVQERLQSRQVEQRERTVTPFLLSGLVYCARCGNKLIGVSRRQRWTTRSGEPRAASYRYYQCESRTNQNACNYNTQRAAELECRIRVALSDEAPGISRIHRTHDPDAHLADSSTQVDRIESKMRRTRRSMEELVADAAHGHISIERMRALGGDLAREQQALEAELFSARQRRDAHQSEVERRRQLADTQKHLVREWESLEFDQCQTHLREVIDRVEVDGDDLRVFLRL